MSNEPPSSNVSIPDPQRASPSSSADTQIWTWILSREQRRPQAKWGCSCLFRFVAAPVLNSDLVVPSFKCVVPTCRAFPPMIRLVKSRCEPGLCGCRGAGPRQRQPLHAPDRPRSSRSREMLSVRRRGRPLYSDAGGQYNQWEIMPLARTPVPSTFFNHSLPTCLQPQPLQQEQ